VEVRELRQLETIVGVGWVVFVIFVLAVFLFPQQLAGRIPSVVTQLFIGCLFLLTAVYVFVSCVGAIKRPTGIPTSKPRSWLVRNRWRIIAITFASIAVIQLLSSADLSGSEVTEVMWTKAIANPAVTERLGAPIQRGRLVSGTWSVGENSGNADVSMPVYGSKRKGTLYAVAVKKAGNWNFETLQLAID
jgi:hypothetical protein